MSCAMRSTSARSCRQVASSFIRSLARTSALYSSLWPSNRPSSPAFWSITASSSRVGQQEPRPPEQVLAHHDLRPAVRPGQRRGLGRTPLVDLERDEASAGLEQPACAGEEGTGHGQPVPAAHQRLARPAPTPAGPPPPPPPRFTLPVARRTWRVKSSTSSTSPSVWGRGIGARESICSSSVRKPTPPPA